MSSYVRKPLSILTSVALGASLALVPPAPLSLAAEAGVTLEFPDISAAHFSRSHVAKLAAYGIITGYKEGDKYVFKPNQAVTHQEAVLMVIRMLGLDDEAEASAQDVYTGLGENNFFRPYVVKALEERILNLAEETAAAAEWDTPWGSHPASREWVAKLVVRAIGQLPNPSEEQLPFTDAANISASAVGFVSKAVELGLITGLPDNSFKPQDPVTRAQLATILSRAEKYMPQDEGRLVAGVVVDFDGEELTVQTQTGAVRTFPLAPQAVVFTAAGQQTTAGELGAMQPVKIAHRDGQALYIELSDEAPAAETFEGEVVSFDAADRVIEIRFGYGDEEQFTLAENAAIVDANGDRQTPSNLTPGSRVRLQRPEGAADITAVTILQAAFNDSGMGTVQSVDMAAGTVTFTDVQGRSATYPVAEGAVITVQGEPLASIADLNTGDGIEYEIVNSRLTKIDVTVPKHLTVSGELNSYADDTITIVGADAGLKAYFLASNVKVIIDGIDDPKLTDLQKGDTVQLRINGASNRVDQIKVADRSLSVLRSADILEYNGDLGYIVVNAGNGKPQFFYITDRTRFLLDGAAMSDSQIDDYIRPGRVATLYVSGDQLVRVEVVTRASGTVTSINPTGKTLTLQRDDGTTVTIPFANPRVDVPGSTSGSFNDVYVGARIRVEYNRSTGVASTIRLEKSFVYTLKEARETTRKLTVVGAGGDSETITLDANTKILDKNGQTTRWSSLPIGGQIVVHYVGRNIEGVKIAAPEYGKVTGVDAAKQQVTVTDFANSTRTYGFDRLASVLNSRNNEISPSSLRLNDRVQIIVDDQEFVHLRVAEGMERKFSSYNGSKNEITFKVTTLGEKSTFPLAPEAYVHTAAGGPLSLDRLKENDALTVYMIDGYVIEIIQ